MGYVADVGDIAEDKGRRWRRIRETSFALSAHAKTLTRADDMAAAMANEGGTAWGPVDRELPARRS
jgi:hypothetical protein